MINQEIVSSLFTVISITGLIANALAIYAVSKNKHLHNTFGSLCAVLATCNIGILLIFLFWCALGSYLFDEEMLIGDIGKRIGQIALFFLDVKMYAHFGVSINRLYSLLFPFKFQELQSNSTTTKCYIGATIFFALIQGFPLFWTDIYYFVYFKNIAVWGFGPTPSNDFYQFYFDFLLSVCMFSCTLFLDAITLFTLWKAFDFTKFSENMQQERKIQIGFFIQSLCQMVPSLFVYFSFTFLSRFATNDWEMFFTTTLVWAILHALDGLIMDIFQARKVLGRMKAKTILVSSTYGGMTTTWTSEAHTGVHNI